MTSQNATVAAEDRRRRGSKRRLWWRLGAAAGTLLHTREGRGEGIQVRSLPTFLLSSHCRYL